MGAILGHYLGTVPGHLVGTRSRPPETPPEAPQLVGTFAAVFRVGVCPPAAAPGLNSSFSGPFQARFSSRLPLLILAPGFPALVSSEEEEEEEAPWD